MERARDCAADAGNRQLLLTMPQWEDSEISHEADVIMSHWPNAGV